MGIAKRKIIVVACIVNIWLYRSAERMVPFGPASWARMSKDSLPPVLKNTSAVTPYMIPMRLWSTVNTHDRQPVVATGRRNTPSEVVGVTAGGAGPIAGTGVGRSMIAIYLPLTTRPPKRLEAPACRTGASPLNDALTSAPRDTQST